MADHNTGTLHLIRDTPNSQAAALQPECACGWVGTLRTVTEPDTLEAGRLAHQEWHAHALAETQAGEPDRG